MTLLSFRNWAAATLFARLLCAGILCAGILCSGCVKADNEGTVPEVEEGRPELRIAPGFTKVDGDNFEVGDRIGLFMLYAQTEADAADVSCQSNVYLDNQEFIALNTGAGVLEWKSGDKLWWKDDSTPADFRCYYPYSVQATGKQMLKCGVCADQSTLDALSDSDILWGESLGVEPTAECVELMTSHRTGQVVVELVPGKGYDKTSLSRALESLIFKGAVCGAVLNLVSGELVAEGEVQDVQPYADELMFRALLPPQNIPDFEVNIVVAGLERRLKTAVNIESNHRRRCTITVDKVTEGVNVGIGGWEDDGEDFGGVLN